MSDVFVSYASQDRHRILPLIHALERTGWSIFWDRTIPAGQTWREVIDTELQQCRSMIVVWTANAITSEWVHEEAEIGKHGNLTEAAFFDKEERFITQKAKGAAVMTFAYDARGNLTESTFRDPNRRLVKGVSGFAKQKLQWDEEL